MSVLDAVSIFVKVIQHGSLSAASRATGVPVTTISAKLTGLEKSLGVTLIRRTTRKLNVTEAGQAFYEHGLRALGEIEAGVHEIAQNKKEPQGLLRITASPSVGHIVLPKLISAYMDQYPKVTVQLMLTNRKVDLVAEGIDLAIRAGEFEDSSLIIKKFQDVKWRLYSSPEYIKKFGSPKSAKEIEKFDYVSFEVIDHGKEIEVLSGKQRTRIQIRPKIRSDDVEAIRIFVEHGRGLAFLPTLMVEREIQSGALVPLLPELTLHLEGNSVALVYPNQRFVPPKVRAFVDMATAQVFRS